MADPLRLVLLGPPCAGKGTQARRLVERFGLDPISTGDIFRRNIQEGTDLGRMAKSFIDAGELVPDEVTVGMVVEAVDAAPGGFILDGFPRNVPQAEALERELAARGRPLSAALAFLLDEEVAMKRVAGRRARPRRPAPGNAVFATPRGGGGGGRGWGAVAPRNGA